MANYDIPTYPSKRPRYFNNQFLIEQDFIDEQAFYIADQRAERRALCATGICEGLTVNLASGHLTVAPGTAIDNNGRLLVLVTASPGPDPAQLVNGTYLLHIAFAPDLETDEANTGLGTKDKTRFTQAPQLAATNRNTPPPVGAIGMATFAVSNGLVTSVTDAGRQNSGVRLPGVSEPAATFTVASNGMATLTSGLSVHEQSGQTRPALRVLDLSGDELFSVDTTGLADAFQLHVSGTSVLDSKLTVKSELEVDGLATFKGQLTADNAASPAIVARSSGATGLLAHGTSIGVQCDANDTACQATNNVSSFMVSLGTRNQAALFQGPVQVNGALTVSDQLLTAGAGLSVTGALSVSGPATTGALTVNGDATITNAVNASGSSTFGSATFGSAMVNGNLAAGALTVTGSQTHMQGTVNGIHIVKVGNVDMFQINPSAKRLILLTGWTLFGAVNP